MLALSQAAFDQISHGGVLLHIPHLELGHHILAALHFEVGIGKNTTTVAFVQHHKSPVRVGMRDLGGEIIVHNAATAAGFAFFSFFGGIGEVRHLFLGGGQMLRLVGQLCFCFRPFFLDGLNLGDQRLDVTRLVNLLLVLAHQLADLFQVGLYRSQFLLRSLNFGRGIHKGGLGGLKFLSLRHKLGLIALFRFLRFDDVGLDFGQVGGRQALAFMLLNEQFLVGPRKIAGGAETNGGESREDFPDHTKSNLRI